MTHKFEEQRRRLVDALRNAGIHDERLLTVLTNIPREMFIDEARRHLAYADNALVAN